MRFVQKKQGKWTKAIAKPTKISRLTGWLNPDRDAVAIDDAGARRLVTYLNPSKSWTIMDIPDDCACVKVIWDWLVPIQTKPADLDPRHTIWCPNTALLPSLNDDARRWRNMTGIRVNLADVTHCDLGDIAAGAIYTPPCARKRSPATLSGFQTSLPTDSRRWHYWKRPKWKIPKNKLVSQGH